jgi:hypothetical protein
MFVSQVSFGQIPGEGKPGGYKRTPSKKRIVLNPIKKTTSYISTSSNGTNKVTINQDGQRTTTRYNADGKEVFTTKGNDTYISHWKSDK